MQVLRLYRLRGIVLHCVRKEAVVFQLRYLMSPWYEDEELMQKYVKEKMREYGMTDKIKVREWIEEVLENTYFTQSMLMSYSVGEQECMLAVNSTAESTRQYHVNVEEYEAEGVISEPHWLKYQVCRRAGRESGRRAYIVCMKYTPP